MEISKEIGFDSNPFFSIQINFSHFFIYYLFLFTGILIIFSIFFNEKPKENLTYIILGSFLIIFVPIIDFLISKGEGYRLSYIFEKPHLNFITGFNPFKISPNISPGQKIVFLLGTLSGSFLIFYKNKNFLKALLFPFILYLWIFFTGILPLLISFILKSSFSEIFTQGGLLITDTQKFSLLFFIFLQINIFILYILENGDLKFFKDYDFLKDLIIPFVFLTSGILVFKNIFYEINLKLFTNKFDYFIFLGFFLLSIYFSISKKLIFEENKNTLIFIVLLFALSLSFEYTLFYLTSLSVLLIYISKFLNFKIYLFIIPYLFLFSSSSIISGTKSFLLFNTKFYLFIFVFVSFLFFLDVKSKILWLFLNTIFYTLPFLFYFKLSIFLVSFIFLLISFILFKFFYQLKNFPSLVYLFIIFLILQDVISKDEEIKNFSLSNFYFKRGEYKESLRYFPEKEEFYPFKGIAYFKISEYDSAVYYFKNYPEKKYDPQIYSFYILSLIAKGEILSAYYLNKKAIEKFGPRKDFLIQREIILKLF